MLSQLDIEEVEAHCEELSYLNIHMKRSMVGAIIDLSI